MDIRSSSATWCHSQTALWTWADVVSTWRFWGLLIAYVLSSAGAFCFSVMISRFMTRTGATTSDISILFSVKAISQFLGFFAAYAATRSSPARVLAFAGILQLVGVCLVIVPGAESSIYVRAVGALCWGAAFGAVTLTVPAMIAGAMGGTGTFAVAFGIVLSTTWLSNPFVALALPLANSVERLDMIPIVMSFAAVAVLLSVRSALFAGDPPSRGHGLPVVRRDPLAVALLSLVPLYPFYWLFRIHGEVYAVEPSRALLSPRGAVGMALVPLMFPIMTTTIADTLNTHAEARQQPRRVSPVGVFVWSLILPPVAMALTQSAMNRTATPAANQ